MARRTGRATISDVAALTGDEYTLTFDGANYTLTNSSDNSSISGS